MSANLLELCSTWYYAADPNYFIILSGIGIIDLKVIKSGLKLPLQNATKVCVTPMNYEFKLHAFSVEKLAFILPCVFTIGPDIGKAKLNEFDANNIRLYSRYLANINHKERDAIIKGILEGETRVLAGKLKIEELFNDRMKFKLEIIDNIDKELHQFGCKVYNANIKELEDAEGSHYFENCRKKILAQSENDAKIDISEAKLKGETVSKENDVKTSLNISKLDMDSSLGVQLNDSKKRIGISKLKCDAIEGENEQSEKISISNNKLELVKVEQKLSIQSASIKTDKEIELIEIELQEKNNKALLKSETEKLRSTLISTATVEAEAIKIKADANLYQKQKEAEGIELMYNAEAKGLNSIKEMFGENTQSLMQYLFMKDNLYVKLAETNSKAINGLNPKITIWNTGSSDNQYTDIISSIGKVIPPLFGTINDQTGIKILPTLVEQTDNKN